MCFQFSNLEVIFGEQVYKTVIKNGYPTKTNIVCFCNVLKDCIDSVYFTSC